MATKREIVLIIQCGRGSLLLIKTLNEDAHDFATDRADRLRCIEVAAFHTDPAPGPSEMKEHIIDDRSLIVSPTHVRSGRARYRCPTGAATESDGATSV